MMTDFSLFAEYPQCRPQIPRFALGKFPTRVHRLAHYGTAIGINNLWVKRDDESSETYGGNKVRKLEFLLAEAMSRGRRSLITIGGYGSHHSLATAIYGKQVGMQVTVILVPQPITEHVLTNIRAMASTGAQIKLASYPLVVVEIIREIMRHPPKERPYFIPAGGSSPVGSLGYVNAAFELRNQIDGGELPEPAYIFLPLGSGGTMAGLVLGLRLAGIHSQVIGVRVVNRLLINRTRTVRLAKETLKLLRSKSKTVPFVDVSSDAMTVLHDFFGDGYGYPIEEAKIEMGRIQRLEGIKLEQTYTGKALAGLAHSVSSMDLKDKPVLFWNTFNSVPIDAMADRVDPNIHLDASLRHLFRQEPKAQKTASYHKVIQDFNNLSNQD